MLTFIKRYARTFFTTSAILVLCLLPSNDLSKIDLLHWNYQDLAVHLVMFGGFSFFLFLDMNKNPHGFSTRRTVVTVACISLSFGLITELMQYWLASLNRTASPTDWLFDLAGTATGISVARFRARSRGPVT